ncbi:MAG: transposase [Planctomycetota bacterium]|nr:transposase [Planctomycetaceae bacterium]MDQ3332762.1 transposase [Planctomycetota bacterium]
MVESDLRLMASVDAEIDRLEQQLQREAWNAPRVRLLMTISGVDYDTALTLIVALGDLSRFEDGDHAAS